MEYLFPLTNPFLFFISFPLRASAALLFLALYLFSLIRKASASKELQPAPVPMWLGVMYPAWLDRLSFRQIIGSFVWSLGVSAALWAVAAMCSLAFLSRFYGA